MADSEYHKHGAADWQQSHDLSETDAADTQSFCDLFYVGEGDVQMNGWTYGNRT